MENNKKVVVYIFILLVVLCLIAGIWMYIYKNNMVMTDVSDNKDNMAIDNNYKSEENVNTVDKDDVKEDVNEYENNTTENEVKYPTTFGPIFKYDINNINKDVINKDKDVTYEEVLSSNPYEISADRKSIKVGEFVINFDSEIYHACFFPIGQGGIDMVAVVLRGGQVKYTIDYGKTIKEGGNEMIDIFPVYYKMTVNNGDRKERGSTILVANQYGRLIDLRLLGSTE